MSKFLPNIVRLMLEISKRGEVDMFVRQSALYFVQTLLGAYVSASSLTIQQQLISNLPANTRSLLSTSWSFPH